MNVLSLWVLGRGELWLDLEGVGTEVVSLGLEEVGWEILGAVTVEPRKCGGETWSWDTDLSGLGNDVSPSWLSLLDGVLEEVGEEEVLELWVLAVGISDVLEENGADDASSAPHEGDGRLVELPVVLLSGLLHEHETLGVGDNLGGVESLLEVLKELLAVTGELGLASNEWKDLRGRGALSLDGRQAAGKDGLSDQGNWHTEIKSVDGSPLSGSLLSSGVEDLLKKWGSVIIVEVHDIAGDLNQERVKDALVPLGENITNLLSGHTETTLHDVVGL